MEQFNFQNWKLDVRIFNKNCHSLEFTFLCDGFQLQPIMQFDGRYTMKYEDMQESSNKKQKKEYLPSLNTNL